MPNGRKPGEKPEPAKPTGRREAKGGKPRMTLEERAERRAERKAERGPGWMPEPDGGVHVPRIMTADALIFPPKLRLALQYYLDVEPRDKARAAARAGMGVGEFERHLHSPGVNEYLHKQEEMIDAKAAELRARARVLTEDHLDAATVDVLESPSTPAPQKVRMIEVGYRRFGLLKDKAEVTGANGAPLPFQLIRITGRRDDDGSDNNPLI